VGGVAQAGLGLGQAMFATRGTSSRLIAAEVAGWNLGNAAVLAGTLLDLTVLVDVGGVLLVVTLGLLARGLRGGVSPADRAGRWLLRLPTPGSHPSHQQPGRAGARPRTSLSHVAA